MNSKIKKLASAAAVAAAAAATFGVAGAPSATAATKDGIINTGELVQWYYTSYRGGCQDDYYADASFWDDRFKNCGQGTSGWGAVVANNSESAANYDYYYTAELYSGTNWTGWRYDLGPRRANPSLPWSHYNSVESLAWHL